MREATQHKANDAVVGRLDPLVMRYVVSRSTRWGLSLISHHDTFEEAREKALTLTGAYSVVKATITFGKNGNVRKWEITA